MLDGNGTVHLMMIDARKGKGKGKGPQKLKSIPTVCWFEDQPRNQRIAGELVD